MTRLSPSAPVDLSRLTAPELVETLDFEAIVAAMVADVVARFPLIANVINLESQPARKLIEACAYREMLMRARVNDAARGLLLAYAGGADLDHKAADHGVRRLTVTPATSNAPAVMESDARLRRRVQLAPAAFNTAGSREAYVYHALTAAPTLADATALQDGPGQVIVTLLGPVALQPSEAELAAVRAAFARDDVRPLTDAIAVRGPTVIETAIDATLTLYPGPAATPVHAEARARLNAFLAGNRRLGADLALSAITAQLYVSGVHSVRITAPDADIAAEPGAIVSPTSIIVRVQGREE
jgi:phage-related baseplate assembly protein